MHPTRPPVSLRCSTGIGNYGSGCSVARICMGAILAVTVTYVFYFSRTEQNLTEQLLIPDEHVPATDNVETAKMIQTQWQMTKQESTIMGTSNSNTKEKQFQMGLGVKHRLSIAPNTSADDKGNEEQSYNAENGDPFENKNGSLENRMNEVIDAGKLERGDSVDKQSIDVYKENQMQQAQDIHDAVRERQSSGTKIESTSYRGDENKDGADETTSAENTLNRARSSDTKDLLSDKNNVDEVPRQQDIAMEYATPKLKHSRNQGDFQKPHALFEQQNPKWNADGKQDVESQKHATDEEDAIRKELAGNEKALDNARATHAVLPLCKRVVLLTDPRHGSTWLLNAVENCLFSASPRQIEQGIMFAHNTFLRTEIWHHLGKDMTAEDVINYATTENSVKIFCHFYKLRQQEARRILRRQQRGGLVFVVLKRDPERAFRSRLRAKRGPDISWRMRGDLEGELTDEEKIKLERYKTQAQKCYTMYENDLRETGATFDILQYEDIVRRKEILLLNSGCRVIDKC